MQDGTKREAVSWKLPAALFWCFLVILNVFVCNMLLKNACKNRRKYVRKTDENGPKMVPKPLQNRSWRGSGGHWGTTLAARGGPVWAHVGHHFFDVFLRWRFDSLGLHFGFPKDLQNETQEGPKPKPENHRFCFYLLHFGHIQGC